MRKSLSVALASILASSVNTATVQADTCEISGLNLVMAYQRALNNGNKFSCRFYNTDTKKWEKDRKTSILPTPHGIRCEHKSLGSLFENVANREKLRGDVKYAMSYFRRGLKNGWKIEDYSASGGGTKANTNGRWVSYQAIKPHDFEWTLSLKKMWIKKNGFSCDNINAVLDSAFGR